MKISKVLGVVLSFHAAIAAMLVLQPGCSTTQPPTKTYNQSGTVSKNIENRTPDSMIQAERVDASLDDAFNAGIGDESYAPMSEFDDLDVAPLDPIETSSPVAPIAPVVDIAGPSYTTYTVVKGDSLWAIAKRNGVSVNELYSANGLNKNSVLKIGQQIQIPTEGGTATVSTVTADTYQPTTLTTGSQTYTVRSGDSLSKIARNYGTSVRAIKAANGKSSDVIRIGEKLVIPVAGSSNTSAAPSTTSAPAPTTTVSGARTHTVKAGEYPGKIAKKYGMTSNELLALNGITDPTKLQVGQVLKVSKDGSASNVSTATQTVSTPAPKPVTPAPAPAPTVSNSGPIPPSAGSEPVAIRVVEADPLVEGEADDIIDIDSELENAVEIPVIRIEEN